MKIKVYSSLSIDEKTLKKILPQAKLCPPIARGQILKDVDQKYNIIAVIDGKFDQSLAIAPSEIRDALRAGVRIYGSSSMGAMRAAETERFGMIGFGKIFEFVRDSKTFRDDFLGQVFQDNTIEYKSYTYIDFYFSVQHLVLKQKIRKAIGEKLCMMYSKLFYADRNLAALRFKVSKSKNHTPEMLNAIELLTRQPFSQKREDAIGLLKLIKTDILKVQKLNRGILKSAALSPDPFKFYPKNLFKI